MLDLSRLISSIDFSAATSEADLVRQVGLHHGGAAERFLIEESAKGFTPVQPVSPHDERLKSFGAAASDERLRVEITSGASFHPPKSGPSEEFQAHVATVTSVEQVKWVIAQLLTDKRICKATHNMLAYRLIDGRGVQVSDCDDDGEMGSGSKLAALLELTSSQNVLVVVSRWFGGTLLGPSRFKYIASTARQALDEAGLLGGGSPSAKAVGKRKAKQ